MSSPSDWIPLYQPNFSNYSYQIHAPLSSISTTTTAAAASTHAVSARTNPLSPNPGRISRPVRRRARASRRAPTTLLNTDTVNFRAMVQHFTGGPATPAAASFASGTHLPNPVNLPPPPVPETAVDPAIRFRVEYAYDQMHHQHMAMMDDSGMHGGKGRGGGGVPPHGLSGGSSSGNENWECDRYMG